MSVKIRHGFSIGNTYDTKQVSSPEEYLQAVWGAEKFLSKNAYETEDGIYWRNNNNWRGVKDETDLSFYSGCAGVLYFYLKLWEATKDEKALDTVKKGAKYLALHWRDFFDQTPVFGSMDLPGSVNGLYFGAAGLGLVLINVYGSTDDETAKAGALEILEYYKKEAKEDADGVYWTGLTGLAMDGGVILMLLQYQKILPDAATEDLIKRAGKHYLKQGDRHPDGGLEFNGCKTFTTVSWPNYEFGTAGAGYLLTLLYENTKDEAYLKAAEDCTIYLKTIRVPQEKGYLIPHDVNTEDGAEPVFFLSSCHGPGGNAKLYYQLYKLTGEKKWLDEITAMVDGIESTGAPEKQSIGLWNTLCFCCGHAGLVQFFIGLYEGLKDDRYRDLAHRTAAVIMGEKEEEADGSVEWPMAFWRLKPEFLTVDIGYYDGVAGIASALLQIWLFEKQDFHWKCLIDDPFPETAGN